MEIPVNSQNREIVRLREPDLSNLKLNGDLNENVTVEYSKVYVRFSRSSADGAVRAGSGQTGKERSTIGFLR